MQKFLIMFYNFDEIINRKNSGALKTDALMERYGRPDLIPLWVADMDFRCGNFITDALKKRVEDGIFGYTIPSQEYSNSIINWVKNRHRWEIRREWLSYIPGIVKGIALAIMNFSRPGDKIIIQPPVYHPFRLVTQMQGRKIVNNPLIEGNGNYRMNLKGLRKVIDQDCKLLLLCNPHNPVGITWTWETLEELADICHNKQVLVISDEIHSDLGIFGNKHTPFATVSVKAMENSITFMAPSKTFNIAGIVSSYSIVPDDRIRKSFYDFLHAGELDEGTIFAFTATHAAYRNGLEWMQRMLRYIENNIRFVDGYLNANIPRIKAILPQASFLLWLDCRELRLSQKDLNALFVEKAGLALNDGEMFGEEGRGFMRMNVGCPRVILEKALGQLKRALEQQAKF